VFVAAENYMKPKVISTEKIYEGKVFDISIAEIDDNGIEYKREIVEHKGSAVIVPVFEDNRVALVRQYRHAAGEYLLEIPAGTLDKDEDPKLGAQRELEEEIGVISHNIEKLVEFYVSPGFLTEKMNVYLATDLKESNQNLEDDEILTIEKLSFAEAFEKIRSNEIKDAKTICGLILAGARLGFPF
jgi:ADP-ribose pyrophosphatase